ncbi:hypothetical protein CKA32_005539 [Geitlerinema sp. FC II]|nr:hypothetical protein CKA32_005539 [Geitlerinema sp. FC II]
MFGFYSQRLKNRNQLLISHSNFSIFPFPVPRSPFPVPRSLFPIPKKTLRKNPAAETGWRERLQWNEIL